METEPNTGSGSRSDNLAEDERLEKVVPANGEPGPADQGGEITEKLVAHQNAADPAATNRPGQPGEF
jgi:hypothetical protein